MCTGGCYCWGTIFGDIVTVGEQYLAILLLWGEIFGDIVTVGGNIWRYCYCGGKYLAIFRQNIFRQQQQQAIWDIWTDIDGGSLPVCGSDIYLQYMCTS